MVPRLVCERREGRARRWLSSLLIAGPLNCRVSRHQTSIHLPVDLHKRVRKYAFDQEVTLSTVMLNAIQEWLDAREGVGRSRQRPASHEAVGGAGPSCPGSLVAQPRMLDGSHGEAR
jgi:hypothetical protein